MLFSFDQEIYDFVSSSQQEAFGHELVLNYKDLPLAGETVKKWLLQHHVLSHRSEMR